MLQKFQTYPRAFWTLLACFFVNRVAAALVWPFMTLFIYTQTNAPLSHITVLLSIQAVASIVGTSFISALMDRYGRKKPMLAGLLAYSIVIVLMSQAGQLWQWALLIALYGILQPVFYVGTNAMVADLIDSDHRTGAFALVRIISNIAIALGPAVGGIFIVRSHLFAYTTTAVLNILLLIPVAWFIAETLPKRKKSDERPAGGYGVVLRDRPFITFIVVFTLLEIGAAMTFNLLSVYVREQYGILEDAFGRLVGINAAMVVLFQYAMTRVTVRFNAFPVLSLGCLFYTAGLTGFAFARTFEQFAAAMIILTIGELMVMPTATALVAGIARPEMRARYMGILSLTYTIGTGLGPMIGGVISDAFAPSAIWYAGAGAALLATTGFVWMARTRQIVVQNAPANPG